MNPDLHIVLDPGHGGSDPGAVGNGVIEKDWTLSFCRYLMMRIKHGCEPFRVSMLRGLDTDMSLHDRGITSRELGADLVLSVHVNANDSPRAHGTQCYYWPGNAIGKQVAETISRSVPESLYRLIDRAIEAKDDPTTKADDWIQRPRHVLEPHAATAVLVEVGFLSNLEDAKALLNPAVQHGLAVACEAGLAEARRLIARAA